MIVLGIESSCDETAVAVLRMDKDNRIRQVLSNRIASSVDKHALYGGVVPEIASRAHAEAISSLTYGALSESGMTMDDIDLIAVTSRPGLIGSLLVGVSFAKSLAYTYKKPIVPVNHIMGHIASCYLRYPELEPPFFAMVASGGHSSFIMVDDYTDAKTVGGTRDDAIGECFDKVGRVIGMPYPSGPEMDRAAYLGNKKAIIFPSASIAGDNLDLSFSGLKTAVLNYINNTRQKGIEPDINDIAASFTYDACSSVVKKLGLAYARYRFDKMVFSGGVSANSHLRKAILDFGEKNHIRIFMPDREYCGDNAAMIAAQGYYDHLSGSVAGLDLNPSSVCDL